MSANKLSIVILDFLKAARVVENVQQLLRQEVDFNFDIKVIDNSENKENAQALQTLEQYKNVEVQIHTKNIGYPKAYNQALKKNNSDYILIVNPDILWKDETILQKMVDFMDANEKVGIMGPKQVNDDGSVAMTVRAFPKLHLQISRRTFLRKLPVLKQLVEYDEMQHLDYAKTQVVDWVQSSCLIVRGDLWRQIGGLNDKDYFLFMSDVELCFDAWKKGYEVVYYPRITVHADGKRLSSGGVKAFFKKWTIRQHLKDAIQYQLNHVGDINPRIDYLKKNGSSALKDLQFKTPMKGIVLAGGSGSRLHPLTKVTSKQLLPIYNKPMIYYPLETLIQAGITEILIIVAPENAGDFLKLLGSGKDFGVRFTYEIQDKPTGIAEAFKIGENFIGKDNVTLVLGDNIFEDNFSEAIQHFQSGGMIFAQEVNDPERFGVIEFDENKKVISLEEKPKNPKSNFVQTGIYVCDNTVIQKVKNQKASARGELEITDLMRMYLEEGTLAVEQIKGAWFDTGTHESMFEASEYVRSREIVEK